MSYSLEYDAPLDVNSYGGLISDEPWAMLRNSQVHPPSGDPHQGATDTLALYVAAFAFFAIIACVLIATLTTHTRLSIRRRPLAT